MRGKKTRLLIQAAAAVFALGYPLIVYFGLTHGSTRFAAWLLLTLTLGHALLRSFQLQRLALRSALAAPLCLAALWLDDRRYMLAMPVLINAGLFSLFFGSLRSPMPLVERFARMRVSDLSEAERSYCRSVTKLWSAFFVFNGATAAVLAARSSLDLWTLYTGLISYILVGLVGAGEYTVRKYRFGRFGDNLTDRLLRAVLCKLPPRSTPP
ncbi:MAG TPA: hypothetical protein VFN67_03100 [Polyangiales bacterium]|jgi:uncharacterized membrane protein|nr:hypothetical protein [Polyangiales bacterium]